MPLLYGYWAVMCANLILPMHVKYNAQVACKGRIFPEKLHRTCQTNLDNLLHILVESLFILRISRLETVMYCGDIPFQSDTNFPPE